MTNKKQHKKRIILLTPVLSHYRKDVYDHFTSSEEFDFIFVGGKKYQNIKSIDNLKGKTFPYWSFFLFNHKFYYLKGAIKYIFKAKPQIIISSGVDFHLIHTVILFLIYRIILRRKFIWWSQGTTGHQGKIGMLARKMMYQCATGILLYSRAGYENLIEMNIKPEKLKVVGNSLNREDYGFLNHDITKESKLDKPFNILFAGRLTSKARLEILINSLTGLKQKGIEDFKCTIIGDGDTERYRAMVHDLQLHDRVVFLGALYGKDTHEYFLEADLFVYPGGIGLSVLHALSFGLPVITNDNYTLHFPEIELLKKDFNGDLYKDNDENDLTEKIVEWKNKLQNAGNSYFNNCIKSIYEHNYLPEQVSCSVLSFVKDQLSGVDE